MPISSGGGVAELANYGKGDISLEVKTYIGDGQYGNNNYYTTITLQHKPEFMIVWGDASVLFVPYNSNNVIVVTGASSSSTITSNLNDWNWNGNTFKVSNDVKPQYQMNSNGFLYHVYSFYKP